VTQHQPSQQHRNQQPQCPRRRGPPRRGRYPGRRAVRVGAAALRAPGLPQRRRS